MAFSTVPHASPISEATLPQPLPSGRLSSVEIMRARTIDIRFSKRERPLARTKNMRTLGLQLTLADERTIAEHLGDADRGTNRVEKIKAACRQPSPFYNEVTPG